MHKFKKLALALSLAFSTFLGGSAILAQGNANTLNDTDIVAKKALTHFHFSDNFNNKKVTPVYNNDDSLLGYYYKFDTHYILISSDKEYSPILMAGSGDIPTANLTAGSKLYYLGGTEVVKANSGDEIIDVMQKKIKKTVDKSKLKINKNPNSKKSWDYYLQGAEISGNTSLKATNNTTLITPMSTASQKLLSVPVYNQNDTISAYRSSACGPTTMSAITEYWKGSKSKTNLRASSYYGGQGNFITHMYDNHGGSGYGMSISSLKSGLVSHARETNYTSVASQIYYYSDYKYEINNSRPVAVKFDSYFTFFEPNYNYAYNYHWVVGKGYYDDTMDQMIIINNNLDGYTSSTQEQWIDYPSNSPILYFVSFNIN